jgi:ankyrin repeat protein
MKYLLLLLWVGFAMAQNTTNLDVFNIARKGTVADVENYLKTDPNGFNSVNEAGVSPLILACYYSNNEVTKALIKLGVDVNGNSKMGSPLMAAVVKNNLEITKLLLEKKANINAADANGITALIYAVQLNNKAMVLLLLEQKVDTTHKDNNGKTAFEHAVLSGNEEIINLLK